MASIASAGGVISGVVAATAASTVWLGAILGTKANKKVKNKTDKNK